MAGTNKRYLRSKAQEWALGESEKGSAYIGISFKVKDTDGEEKFVSWRGFFTEATTERTIESLRAMGFEGDDLSNLVGLDKNEVELVVEDEEYEGKTYARVQWVNKPRGPGVKNQLEGQKLGAFAAQMKQAFRAHDASNGKRVGTKPAAAPAGDPRPEPPPLSDADIPF
jgi:hypothetical protein